MTTSQRKVLVSGVSGFVGSHVAHTFLQRGFHVRGTVRSQSKADAVAALEAFAPYVSSGKLEFSIVSDVITGDFAPALEGITTFVHTASPFALAGTDNRKDFLDPALLGTKNALKAAKAAGVTHFVVTSSFASIWSPADEGFPYSHKVYTEEDWCPLTYEAAAATDNATVGYVASKKIAEEACWDFQKSEAPSMKVSAICPPMVFGPFIHTTKSATLGESLGQVRDIVTAKTPDGAVPPTGFPLFADVRDVALAHVLAVEKSADGRFAVTSGNFDNQMVADIAYDKFPQEAEKYGVPKGTKGEYLTSKPGLVALKNDKSKKVLGVPYEHSLEQTFVDTIRDVYKYI